MEVEILARKPDIRTGILKWEGYKINENIYNEAYQDIMYYLKDRKYFDIEDIKKWLKR